MNVAKYKFIQFIFKITHGHFYKKSYVQLLGFFSPIVYCCDKTQKQNLSKISLQARQIRVCFCDSSRAPERIAAAEEDKRRVFITLSGFHGTTKKAYLA